MSLGRIYKPSGFKKLERIIYKIDCVGSAPGGEIKMPPYVGGIINLCI
jgi:hypothetical protein